MNSVAPQHLLVLLILMAFTEISQTEHDVRVYLDDRNCIAGFQGFASSTDKLGQFWPVYHICSENTPAFFRNRSLEMYAK